MYPPKENLKMFAHRFTIPAGTTVQTRDIIDDQMAWTKIKTTKTLGFSRHDYSEETRLVFRHHNKFVAVESADIKFAQAFDAGICNRDMAMREKQMKYWASKRGRKPGKMKKVV